MVSALPTSHGFHEAQQKPCSWKCFMSPLIWRYMGRSLIREFVRLHAWMLHPRLVARATPPGAATSCTHEGLRLFTSFWEDVANRASRLLSGPVHTAPHWPPHTRFVTSSPKHKMMTSAVEVKCEAQSRCRGSVCGGGSLPCPPLSVSPLAQSSCTHGSLQPHWAKVSVGSLRLWLE